MRRIHLTNNGVQFKKAACDRLPTVPIVRECTTTAIFNTIVRIGKVAVAALSQHIERAVAKQTVKGFRGIGLMTGKVLALFV